MKIRLDQYVFQEGYTESRRRAQAIIMSGVVFVNNQKADKPGTMIKETDVVEVRGKELKYVSRGGLKLEKAINEYVIDLADTVCMDIGASTGGFTDCMLQNGAVKVYAIDVGYGQLAWKLRSDERVVCMEKTNFRYVTDEQIKEPVDFASVDVSFISLSKILPVAFPLLREDGEMACLIKPQFEAGREKVGKKGVVRDPKVHEEVINNVFGFAAEAGFYICGLEYSPVRGPEGNIEYLMYLRKNADEQEALEDGRISEVVNRAHESL